MYSTLKICTILLCLASNAAGFSLTILHTNDVHARVEQMSKYGARCDNSSAEQGQCYGGVARRKTAISQLKEVEENVLLLDGGDQFQGTSWFTVYDGDETALFMNRLDYDAMTLGNHEFDRGPATLGRFLHNTTFNVVSANVDASREPALSGLFNKSVVLERGGQKIGIIGYTFRDTPFLSSPGPNVKFIDEIEAVKSEASKLTTAGIKLIIALGHSGFEKDKEIAQKVPEVDVVVGGHTNTFLYTGTPPSNEVPQGPYPTIVTQPSGRKVPVVQDFAFGKYLGVLRLQFDDSGELQAWGGNPLLLNSSHAQDPAIMTEVNEWAKKVRDYGAKEAGETYVNLNNSCRLHECNLGNLITDAMIKAAMRKPINGSWAQVSIAMQNGGGIRSSIKQGMVIQDDIIAVLPFRNTLTLVDMKGSDLVAALEHSVGDYGTEFISGRFLQFSGLKVKYNVNKPKGSRVVSVLVRCSHCTEPVYELLNPDVDYPVLTNNYVRSGGDKYVVFRDKAKNEVDIGTDMSNLLARYMTQHSPIIHGTEGRIEFVTDETCKPVNAGFKIKYFEYNMASIFIFVLVSHWA